MRWFLVCLAIAGCARAREQNSIIGGLNDAQPSGDAGAPPGQVTLTQTASDAITVDNSFACLTGGKMRANSYYRVFTLTDYNIQTTLHVTSVSFGIQTAMAGGGAATQPATVNLGTYGTVPQGTTLDLAQVRSLATMAIQIPNGAETTMTVPIAGDVAPTTSVIAELAIPDGSSVGNNFRIGSNIADERAPGYTLGPACGFTTPTSMQSIADDMGFGQVHIVMTVTGTTSDPPN